MLHKGFVIVWNYTVGLMPWNPEHGSTAIPLRTLLTSHPLNLHLARDSHITEPYEHLTIQISGIPPHLCCNSVVYSLFNTICTIHAINFIPARIEYELSAHGQLTLIPEIAHLGIRNLTGQNDLVSIWQLSYQTFTDEMLGRLTPPGDRESELRGYSDLDTEQRLELFDDASPDEATSRRQDTSDDSTMDTSHDDSQG